MSTCYSACASLWPPLTTSGGVRGSSAILASQLGTTKRTDGTTKVTYHGHPLYYYAGDSNPGDTTGQGLNQYRGLVLDSLAALSHIGVAAGALAALLISERTSLFGFMEHGYRLEIVIAIAAGTVAIVALGFFVVHVQNRMRAERRSAGHRPGRPLNTTGARLARENER